MRKQPAPETIENLATAAREWLEWRYDAANTLGKGSLNSVLDAVERAKESAMVEEGTYDDLRTVIAALAIANTKQADEIKRLKARVKKLNAELKTRPDVRQIDMFDGEKKE